MRDEILLDGPRGDNPLGFLATLGTVATLQDVGRQPLLGWRGSKPVLSLCLDPEAPSALPQPPDARERLAALVHAALRREPGTQVDETERAKKKMNAAKTAFTKKRSEVKSRKLDRQESRDARQREVEPLRAVFLEKRAAFRELLAKSAADPSVALGENLTEDNGTFLEFVVSAAERSTFTDRRWVDLVAAYGVADPGRSEERMQGTPWALVSGSGHQHFLGGVQKLMVSCTSSHFGRALFAPWEPEDEKCSLRLDAADDRRHALMDKDPTAAGSEPKTLWGANRLAFEALRFFAAVPTRGGTGVVAWREGDGDWQDGCKVRWPLWGPFIGPSVIKSLLAFPHVWNDTRESRVQLARMGVHAVMETQRIAVGSGANKKFNLTPPVPVWVASAENSPSR